ncbi:MAG: copper chaperone PCu(A)C [Chloroflexi bacterium]|nr:copper chaperone PCu(A)C [Chloroflexota bacterium]
MLSRAAVSALALLLALSVMACGSSASKTTQPAGGFVSVSGAWVREAASGGVTAAYLTITNGRLDDETLVGVSTPAAPAASLHQTTTTDGVTGMEPVDGIAIPAGETVRLEPGGYHIMLEGLTAELAAGQVVQLTLTFEGAGAIDVPAEVRAN